MCRRDQPWAANCCMLFCSFTLRIFAIVPADLPYTEHSAETNRRLKVGNLESVKRDHFRPEVVPFQRPLTFPGFILHWTMRLYFSIASSEVLFTNLLSTRARTNLITWLGQFPSS